MKVYINFGIVNEYEIEGHKRRQHINAIQGVGEWIDISSIVKQKNFKRTLRVGENGKFARSTLNFSISPILGDRYIAEEIFTTLGDVRAKFLTDDNKPYFIGTIRPKSSIKGTSTIVEDMNLEVLDDSYFLEWVTNYDKTIRATYIYNNENKDNSLIHILTKKYTGGNLANINITADENVGTPTLNALAKIEEGKPLKKVVDEIFYEFNLNYKFLEDGTMHIFRSDFDSKTETPSKTLTDSNFVKTMSVSRSNDGKGIVKVWYYDGRIGNRIIAKYNLSDKLTEDETGNPRNLGAISPNRPEDWYQRYKVIEMKHNYEGGTIKYFPSDEWTEIQIEQTDPTDGKYKILRVFEDSISVKIDGGEYLSGFKILALDTNPNGTVGYTTTFNRSEGWQDAGEGWERTEYFDNYKRIAFEPLNVNVDTSRINDLIVKVQIEMLPFGSEKVITSAHRGETKSNYKVSCFSSLEVVGKCIYLNTDGSKNSLTFGEEGLGAQELTEYTCKYLVGGESGSDDIIKLAKRLQIERQGGGITYTSKVKREIGDKLEVGDVYSLKSDLLGIDTIAMLIEKVDAAESNSDILTSVKFVGMQDINSIGTGTTTHKKGRGESKDIVEELELLTDTEYIEAETTEVSVFLKGDVLKTAPKQVWYVNDEYHSETFGVAKMTFPISILEKIENIIRVDLFTLAEPTKIIATASITIYNLTIEEYTPSVDSIIKTPSILFFKK